MEKLKYLGMEIIRSIKNPLLILFLPFRIVSLLFFKKTSPIIFEEKTQSGILIIGIDRIGDNFSLQAQSLGEIISESNLGEVSLFNNSLKPPMNLEQIEWYRLPSVREKNKSRKDWIMFSDPDEIPNPEKLRGIKMSKKYAIFLQNMYTYKINIFNQYESPWEGTRICKKKDLKSIEGNKKF